MDIIENLLGDYGVIINPDDEIISQFYPKFIFYNNCLYFPRYDWSSKKVLNKIIRSIINYDINEDYEIIMKSLDTEYACKWCKKTIITKDRSYRGSQNKYIFHKHKCECNKYTFKISRENGVDIFCMDDVNKSVLLNESYNEFNKTIKCLINNKYKVNIYECDVSNFDYYRLIKQPTTSIIPQNKLKSD